MNKPTVVLKNLKTFMGMEGQGFNVDVWINGVKSIFVMDTANGGCFDYQNYTHNNPKAEQVKTNVQLLEAYIKSLPEYPMEINGEPYMRDGKVVMMKPDMDNFIDDMIVSLQKAKEAKKMVRLMKTSFFHAQAQAPKQFGRRWHRADSHNARRDTRYRHAEYTRNGFQLMSFYSIL